MRILELYENYLITCEQDTFEKEIRNSLPVIWKVDKPEYMPIEVWKTMGNRWLKRTTQMPLSSKKVVISKYDIDRSELIMRADDAWYEAIEDADAFITLMYEGWQSFWNEYEKNIEQFGREYSNVQRKKEEIFDL